MLLGSVLEQVDCYKYLGVLLTSDLSWSFHVGSICTKARHVLGLLYRRFPGSTSQNSLKQLYLSLVRPHMEYACQVWDPHLAKDKKAIVSHVCIGTHTFAMFYAHVLCEGCGHTHTQAWRPLPNLLKYALCMPLGIVWPLSGQFFFLLVSATLLVTQEVGKKNFQNKWSGI